MTKITTIVFMRGGQLLKIQLLKKSRMSRFGKKNIPIEIINNLTHFYDLN
jgi:hypothetical protein